MNEQQKNTWRWVGGIAIGMLLLYLIYRLGVATGAAG